MNVIFTLNLAIINACNSKYEIFCKPVNAVKYFSTVLVQKFLVVYNNYLHNITYKGYYRRQIDEGWRSPFNNNYMFYRTWNIMNVDVYISIYISIIWYGSWDNKINNNYLLLIFTFRNVRNKIQRTIADHFEVPKHKLYLTSPTFFSQMTTKEAKTLHDEYWHVHTDKVSCDPPPKSTHH